MTFRHVTGIFLAVVIMSVAVSSAEVDSALDFTMQNIRGEDVPLSTYRGKVVLIVNVASKCGLTPQYEGLQALYEKYSERGLAILGFPANNFAGQEPGTNSEIQQFCRVNYGVTFPMFGKISVKGDDQHPLYAFLTGEKTNPEYSGEIPWNFTKFLIGRDGSVIGRFDPKTVPESDEIVQAVERALESSGSTE